jgi:hypothetical protein
VITANGDLPPAFLRAEPLRGVDPYLLTATVAAGAGTLQSAARDPAPPGLPTIRPWQRRYADALTAWLGQRAGWR